MTYEQIKQNADEYAHKVTNSNSKKELCKIINDFIAGAHSRDEEIAKLKRLYEEVLRKYYETECKFFNPWISVKDRLPEEDPDGKGYSVEVISLFPDGSVSKCFCSMEENIWFFEGIPCDKPTHWMPLPKV